MAVYKDRDIEIGKNRECSTHKALASIQPSMALKERFSTCGFQLLATLYSQIFTL